MIDIKICTTEEWTDNIWSSYCQSFNAVFNRGFDLPYFKHKYLQTVDGHSFHALLIYDSNVVGACTVIPTLYKKEGRIIKLGQAVDVYIVKEYRVDPLMLRRMYIMLKPLLIENNIIAVMAVPNTTAYSYWKNVVKWKDVGLINYWVFPIKIGNILHKSRVLNFFSRIYCSLLIGISFLFSCLNSRQRQMTYSILESSQFIDSRFEKDYYRVEIGNIKNYYRIYIENGVKTAYLIYSRENDVLSLKSLYYGVLHLIKDHNVDLIVYIGPIRFFQTLFLKVPRILELKSLPLTCDLLMDDNNSYKDMLDLSNWDFGLLNYDVR